MDLKRRAVKYMEQKWISLKEEIENSTVIAEISIPLFQAWMEPLG